MAENSVLDRLVTELTLGQFGSGAPDGQFLAKSLVVIVFGVPAIVSCWAFWSSQVTTAIETTRSKTPASQTAEVDSIIANKEFQRGLRRLGCYDGGIDGVWGEKSKQALTDMIDALGRSDDFPGTTVKHSDIREMLAHATRSLCTKWRKLERIKSARSEYAVQLASYRVNCQIDFFGTALHSWSTQCADSRTDLKSARDNIEALQESK